MLVGAKGRFFVNRGGIYGKPVDQLKDDPLPERAITELYRGKRPGNHMGNFFECVKSRDLPISDAFGHHRTVSILHLVNLCLQFGRKLTWDLATEQIVGDDVASAMQSREQLRERLQLPIYFAHAYSSNERATNENTNGLLRQYFPKKTDFRDISHHALAHVTNRLNNRPRKRLNYLTPLEALNKAGFALQM